MRTVYRLEHKDNGWGPYWNQRPNGIPLPNHINKVLDTHNGSFSHPGPWRDLISDEDRRRFIDWQNRKAGFSADSQANFRCGCLSVLDLSAWFHPVFLDLLSIDYVIKEYRVSERNVLIGRNQVVFLLPNKRK